jgi:hypothetical protein
MTRSTLTRIIAVVLICLGLTAAHAAAQPGLTAQLAKPYQHGQPSELNPGQQVASCCFGSTISDINVIAPFTTPHAVTSPVCRAWNAGVRTTASSVDLFMQANTSDGSAWAGMFVFITVLDNTTAQQPQFETDFLHLTGSPLYAVMKVDASLEHRYRLHIDRENADGTVYLGESCDSAISNQVN